MAFNLGDKVKHNLFGMGIIEQSDDAFSTVFFDDSQQSKRLMNRFLEFVSLGVKTEEVTELVIYPNNYKDLSDISTNVHSLIDMLSSNNMCGQLFLDVLIGEQKVHLLLSNKGLIIFQQGNINLSLYASAKSLVIMALKRTLQGIKDKAVNALTLSNVLMSSAKLIVDIESVVFLENYNKELLSDLDQNNIKYITKELASTFDLNSKLIEKHKKTIVSFLAPKYVVVIPKHANHLNSYLPKDRNTYSSGIELSMLKEEQVKTLENIKEGINIILANAGSGKSVVLLAKAYELCSRGYKNVLVTCYNNNLCEEYKYKKEECGLTGKKDLHIYTFHKFVIKYCRDMFSREYTYDEIDSAVDFLIAKITLNKTKYVKFDAILIDEMQIFEAKWLDLCYLLLNDPKEESYFVMVGDINQDVKGFSKDANLNFYQTQYIPETMKNIEISYLHYNYRNTIEITEYLNTMLVNHTNLMQALRIKRINGIDSYVLGNSITHGVKPSYKKSKRATIVDDIIGEIKRLKNDCKLQYGDIAIIFPYQERVFAKYHIAKWISKELEKENIPFNYIFGDSIGRIRMSEVDGVVLSTIDSSLGLDFKAVILCGLYTLESYHYVDEEGNVKTKKVTSKINQKDRYAFDEFILVEGYKLYIACSRAREHLIVLNDLDKENILVDSIFRGWN